jgi:hypothetical protein
LHAVLLGADGTAFFAGLAKRGEDGDLSIISDFSPLNCYLRSFLFIVILLSQAPKATKIKSP